MRIDHVALVAAVMFAACADSASDSALETAAPEGEGTPAAVAPPPSAEAVVAALQRVPVEEVWPGFAPSSVPVALFDGERTWLVAHPAPPPGFEPAPGLAGVVLYPGRHAAVRGNMPTEIGGVSTAAVLLNELPGMTADRAAAVVAHERFHVHQLRNHPGWTTNELAIFQYPATDAPKLFDRRLETLALSRSLQATSETQSECWLRTALLLRRKRMGELPEPVAAFERGIERQEGLARYVERRAAGMRIPVDVPPHDFPPDEVRGRAYVTGEALAVMLDRYAPDWKEQLAAATDAAPPLDSLLWLALDERPETSCGFSAAERADVLERAHASVAAVRAARDSLAHAFQQRPGWSIRVITAGSPLWPQSFDPMSITRVGPVALIHERMLRAGNDAGFIDVFDGRALTIGATADPLMGGMREVLVTGIAERPAVASGEDIRVRVVAEGIELSFTDAHVETNDQEIVVRLQ